MDGWMDGLKLGEGQIQLENILISNFIKQIIIKNIISKSTYFII